MFKKIGGLNHQIQNFPDLLWDEVEFILLMVQISFHQFLSLKGVLYVSTLPEFLSWTVFHRPGFLWNKFENSLILSKLEWGVVWRFYKSPDLCRVLGSVSVHWKFKQCDHSGGITCKLLLQNENHATSMIHIPAGSMMSTWQQPHKRFNDLHRICSMFLGNSIETLYESLSTQKSSKNLSEVPDVRHAKRCTMKRTFNNIFSMSILSIKLQRTTCQPKPLSTVALNHSVWECCENVTPAKYQLRSEHL